MLSDTPPTDGEVAAMSSREYRSYEARVRRAAQRQGLALCKSRTRDPRALDYGTYGLVQVTAPGGHWRSRLLVVGDHSTGYGCALNEIHAALVERAVP